MRLVRRLAALLLATVVVVLALGGTSATAAQDDRPLVRVGTEGTYPPFTFREAGSKDLTGYDVEVMRAVAKKAGWRLQFVDSQFDAIFAALDAKRIDVIANQISINPERKATYDFSQPYTYSHGVIVVKKGERGITSLADLKGRTTAQSLTSNWAQVAKDAGAKVEGVDQFSQAAALVAQGRVDAIVNDNIAVLDYLTTSGSDDVEIVGAAGDEVSEQALTFRKGDPRRDEADRALDAIRQDGTLAKISQKYFKADVSREDGGDVDVSGGRGEASTVDTLQDAAWPMLRGLVAATIPITVISFVLGLVLAVLTALARLSGVRVLDVLARVYISIIRGTPLLLQLFIVFYGLPEIGIDLGSWPSAILALSINVGAYAAEIVRSSILSVPRGQLEAAASIGMGYWQSLRRVVLPQAARIAVPPLSNTLISLVKDTSLLSVVLVTELFREAQYAASTSFNFLALYTFAGVYYWIVCTVLAYGQDKLEHRLNRYVAR